MRNQTTQVPNPQTARCLLGKIDGVIVGLIDGENVGVVDGPLVGVSVLKVERG